MNLISLHLLLPRLPYPPSLSQWLSSSEYELPTEAELAARAAEQMAAAAAEGGYADDDGSAGYGDNGDDVYIDYGNAEYGSGNGGGGERLSVESAALQAAEARAAAQAQADDAAANGGTAAVR